MERKILVTAALPYVNNIPHLGNLVPTLSADIYAEFQRLKKKNCIFICGTDEHGTTTEVKAIEEGVTPKEICDKYYKIHKKIYKWLNLRFDHFGRTSSKQNYEITIDIFKKLDKNGFIIKDYIDQFFCEKCEKYLADRFVEGTCPYCNFPDARGDQCDNCTKLLDPAQLIEPKCKFCKNTPVIKKEEHLFIDLIKLEPLLKIWIEKTSKNWAVNAITMTTGWLKTGLKPRCITRNLKWGIPVPGYKDKVFYSWFDAPIGYISITAEKFSDWKKWWKSGNDKLESEVRLVQFMGKDNIPFHTILFPSFLIGTKDNYTLLDTISSNEYLNYETGKFSKSRGEGIFGDDAIETGIPPDVWRYYLMINRPEKTDTTFTWKDFQEKLNNELVANLGNFINRLITFIANNYNSEIPKPIITEKEKEFLDTLRKEYKKIDDLLEEIRLKDALRNIMLVAKQGNQYFQENEPWNKIRDKNKKIIADNTIYILANLAKDLAILLRPFLPTTSDSILAQLNLGKEICLWENLGKLIIEEKHKIDKQKILFEKLEDKELEKFKYKFSGKKANIDEEKKSIDIADLRVAKILNVEDIKSSDKLYKIQIEIGKEKRQIVAGIKKFYSKEELKDKNIVVVYNLKPAMLRGELSQGMLLAAEDKDHVIELVDPGTAKSGDRVLTKNKLEQKREITIEDFLKIDLKVGKNRRIFSDNFELKTKHGPLFVLRVEEGSKVR